MPSPCPVNGLDVVLGCRSRQGTKPARGSQHRKAKGRAPADQMLGVRELDPVDPGRCLAPGAGDQTRQIEQDHLVPRVAGPDDLLNGLHIVPDTVL